MLELRHNFIAEDQYGNTIFINKYPRKELMEHVGIKHANKMYADINDETYHIGYVIGGYWFAVFRLEPFKVNSDD